MMTSGPPPLAMLFAFAMVCRNEPGPASLVFMTTSNAKRRRSSSVSATARRSRAAAARLVIALLPSAARAQHRAKLENRESDWAQHRYGANVEAVVLSRDGTRSVLVVSRDRMLYVVDGALPVPAPAPMDPRALEPG